MSRARARSGPQQRVPPLAPAHGWQVPAAWADDELDLPAFLSPKEVAALLRVSVWAVYDAVKDETLPAVRIGRAIRIPRTAVAAPAPSNRQQEP